MRIAIERPSSTSAEPARSERRVEHAGAPVLRERAAPQAEPPRAAPARAPEDTPVPAKLERAFGTALWSVRDSIEPVAPPAIQRLTQPIVKPAPANVITIRDFIKLVQAEEARWPPAEQTQTGLMITRLRKIFYGTSGWDKYLIPGAAGISPNYTIGEVETGRENLSLPGPDADIVRRRQTVASSGGGSPAIASQQEVRLEDGTFCDVGHVFTGLDALNYPTAVTAPLGAVTVQDNVGAVTWTGDLGSVLAEIYFATTNAGHALSEPQRQAIVDDYASAQDMLGDIDAYAMASAFNITNAGGRKVSDLLSEYYLGVTTTSGGNARVHRYSRFCAAIGLVGWSGSAFSNEAAWIARWTPDVAASAALYIGANTEGAMSAATRAGAMVGIQMHPLAKTLVENFLTALKLLVAAEPP